MLLEGFFCVVRSVLSVLGAAGNIINIDTFISMGISDSMVVTMLFMAVFDLLHLIAMLSRAVSFVFYVVENTRGFSMWFPVDPYGVYVFFGHAGRIPYTMVALTTTYLAVTRCMCVARPLQFKTTFTTRLSVIILSSLAILSVATYVPILVYMAMLPGFDPKINATRPLLWISPQRDFVKKIVWTIRDVVLPVATLFTVIICATVMSERLLASTRFRQSHFHVAELAQHVHQSAEIPIIHTIAHPCERPTVKNTSGTTEISVKLCAKDLRIVQQMILISVVFVVCNIPEMFVSFVSLLEPDFGLGRPYSNIYMTAISLEYFFRTVHSSCHIFIYYKYSAKYRR
ncbi:unnamed protein product, partial [Lymnaea stagnalis]